MAKKRLAILGSTGSIGTQTLEIVAAHPQLFSVEILTAHANADLLLEQVAQHQPNAVVLTQQAAYEKVKQALSTSNTKVFFGQEALNDVVTWDSVDFVLAAIVGYAGLQPTLSAIRAKKPIGLANKETLVVAGAIVMEEARNNGVPIIPVDSEHSAIFQCLLGEDMATIEKVILTASGGPFLGKKPNFLVNVKKSHALQHPNWTMGEKISIDSATLMNKGLEMIEAKWLFGLRNDQIEVVIHPQSIIHSLVQFNDGSIKAQIGLPDMKLPIQYAMAFPKRVPNAFPRFSFKDYSKFTFEQPDVKTFRNLQLAMDALEKGGNAPCILNAANEVVVNAFIHNKIGFLQMSDLIEESLNSVNYIENPTLEELVETDRYTRSFTQKELDKLDY
ncbi:MAG TPA: 1-deoxy-D-xylulose-5-phosphate reductoisomerase [Edaphocola sp.]|nr:1-deoxy-D-xylulose-5-phosphate reductoisomerase [Edaphocola sp.]